MSGSDAPDSDPKSSEHPRSEPTESTSRWWMGAITFVAGIVVGVLAVGLLSSGTPDFAAAHNAPSTAATQARPTGVETAGVTGTAEVNLACLRVINEAQDVYTILTGADEAVQDVDLQALDDLVRRLQPVEPRLQRDLLECRIATSVDTGPSAGTTTPGQPVTSTGPLEPTVSPTASPTR